MNSKAIAVIMAVAMAAVGFSVAIADDADAADVKDFGRQAIAAEGTTNILVGINEGNYTGYDYTVTWTLNITTADVTNKESQTLFTYNKTGDSSNDNTVYVADIGFTRSDSMKYSISMTRDGTDIGKYTIDITAGNSATAKDIAFSLKPTIVVTTADKDSITFDDFVEYTFSVAVIAPTGGTLNLELNNSTAQVGKYYSGDIQFAPGSGQDNMVVSEYDWYAVGLPEGLTMASNGQVSGIPTKGADADEKNPYNITVFATDKNGNMYYGKIDGFKVAAKQTAVEANGFGYYINEASPAEDVTSVGSNKATYLFSADEAKAGIKLYLTDGGGIQITEADVLNGYTVKVIAEDGAIGTLNPADGQTFYDLPHSGSGAYTVTITDTSKKTAAFTVYIIGEASDITASIVIEGA